MTFLVAIIMKGLSKHYMNIKAYYSMSHGAIFESEQSKKERFAHWQQHD
jgi:hypothetical protein